MRILFCAILVCFLFCGCAESYSVDELRMKTISAHPEWNSETKEAIAKGQLVKGMTVEQTQAVFPDNYLHFDYADSSGEAWYYVDHVVFLESGFRSSTDYESFLAGFGGQDGAEELRYGRLLLTFKNGELARWSFRPGLHD